MNQSKRFKTFMTENDGGRWATVKNIGIGTVSKHSPHIVFGKTFEKIIGKRFHFVPIYSPAATSKEIKNVNEHIWKHTYTDYTGIKRVIYFDPAWLKFDKEDPQQTHLFPSD